MSSTFVTASGVGSPWSCRSCSHTNAYSVTQLAAQAMVPCNKCGAFSPIARPPASTQRPKPITPNAAPSPASSNGSHPIPVVHTSSPLSLDDDSVVERFRSFIRIRTVANEGTTNGANEEAVAFLKAIGENMGLQARVFEYKEHRPILVLTLPGRDPSLKSICLNSHYDVVPVMRDQWKCDPFEALMTEELFLNANQVPVEEEESKKLKIYGRGTQDMKAICMQYLEAIMVLLRAKKAGPFLRTIHLTFQPDEETGGEFGMQQFVQTEEFRALNIGFALDEGIANPKDEYTVFYGERGVWWMTLKATGPTGHASRFIPNPATMKLLKSVQHFLDYRTAQEKKLLRGQEHHGAECAHAISHKLELGDVITINLTVLKAGVSVDGGKTYSMNVVPMEAEAGFDIRLPPHVDLNEFEDMIKQWTSEDGLSYSIRKFSAEYVTQIDAERNPFWREFKATLEKFGEGTTKVKPQVFPAGTDSRFLRKAGIPVIGFSPLRKTPILLHDHNEYLNREIFLEGVKVYADLIPALANLAEVMKNEDGVYLQVKQPLDRVDARTGEIVVERTGGGKQPAAAQNGESKTSNGAEGENPVVASPPAGALSSSASSSSDSASGPTPTSHLCETCTTSPSSPFNSVLHSSFPQARGLEQFIFDTKQLLVPLGFFPQVNTLATVGLCRDEITSKFEEEVEAVWGQAFLSGSLGGMLFCGNTGFGAAHAHAPRNGRLVYYAFTHIAIDHEGHIGSVYRTKSGMSEKTTACGALAAFTKELATGKVNTDLHEDDIEQCMLKKHICASTPALTREAGPPPSLLEVTFAAYETITKDLERHVLADSKKYPEREYALFSGVQIHGPDNADYVWLGKSSTIHQGELKKLEFVKVAPYDWTSLTPPVLPSAFEAEQ